MGDASDDCSFGRRVGAYLMEYKVIRTVRDGSAAVYNSRYRTMCHHRESDLTPGLRLLILLL